MGTLFSALGKTQQELPTISKELLEIFKQWIKKQFPAMICRNNAADLIIHLIVLTQDVSTMAYIHNFRQFRGCCYGIENQQYHTKHHGIIPPHFCRL